MAGFADGSVAQVSDSIEPIINARRTLIGRLDSLEMEKQVRKRQGESLADLEEQSRRIHDSLAAIRTKLTDEIPAEFSARSGPVQRDLFGDLRKMVWKPATLFDWIIVVVGFIAVFSGVILVGGVMHSLISRSGVKPRPSKPAMNRPATQQPPAESRFPAPPAHCDSDTGGLAALRNRMREDRDQIHRFNATGAPTPSPQKPGDQMAKQEDRQEGRPVRDTILRAAREGLTVQEISKKYHVSVDQVTLVLRIAKKG